MASSVLSCAYQGALHLGCWSTLSDGVPSRQSSLPNMTPHVQTLLCLLPFWKPELAFTLLLRPKNWVHLRLALCPIHSPGSLAYSSLCTTNLVLATHSQDFKEPSKHPLLPQWPLVVTVARVICLDILPFLWTLIPHSSSSPVQDSGSGSSHPWPRLPPCGSPCSCLETTLLSSHTPHFAFKFRWCFSSHAHGTTLGCLSGLLPPHHSCLRQASPKQGPPKNPIWNHNPRHLSSASFFLLFLLADIH